MCSIAGGPQRCHRHTGWPTSFCYRFGFTRFDSTTGASGCAIVAMANARLSFTVCLVGFRAHQSSVLVLRLDESWHLFLSLYFSLFLFLFLQSPVRGPARMWVVQTTATKY